MGHMVRDDFKIALLPAWRAWENYTCALDLSRRCALECERRYWKQVALKSLDAYFMRIEREAAIIDVPPAWRKLAGVK